MKANELDKKFDAGEDVSKFFDLSKTRCAENGSISFSRREETLAAKVRWFQQKSIGERLVAALEWMDFLRLISPKKVSHGIVCRKRKKSA